jgi:hypothetical protein
VRERAAFSLGMLFHFKILNNMGIMGIKFFAFWYHICKKSKVYGRKIR